MQPLCQPVGRYFIRTAKLATEQPGNPLADCVIAEFCRGLDGVSEIRCADQLRAITHGENSVPMHVFMASRFIKVHAAVKAARDNASQLSRATCGSGLARESGVSGDINVDCTAVFASKPAPTGSRCLLSAICPYTRHLYFHASRGRDLLAHAGWPSIERHRATVC